MQQWFLLLNVNRDIIHYKITSRQRSTDVNESLCNNRLYKREMIGFWHVVLGKLCLPSQYAEDFTDLDASHAICLSSDSWAKTARDVLLLPSHGAAVRVPVARDFHLPFDIKAHITHLFMIQCFTSKQQRYLLGILVWREGPHIR